jgi:transposase-like protein
MMIMPAPRKYTKELRERAVRLVFEALEKQEDGAPLTPVLLRIGQMTGVNPETLRIWVRQRQVDVGKRPGTTTSDAKRIKDLEHEVKELKRANEILLAASSFFAREQARDCPGERVHHRAPQGVGGLADLPGP